MRHTIVTTFYHQMRTVLHVLAAIMLAVNFVGPVQAVSAAGIEKAGTTSLSAAISQSGFFPEYLQGFTNSRAVALGDLNKDDQIDIVLGGGSTAGQPGKIYLDIEPDSTPTSFAAGDNTYGAAVGDMDNDDDLDIILANHNRPSKIYWNDGDGGFQPATVDFNVVAAASMAVAVGDLRPDGLNDIVLANDGESFIYFNEGDGASYEEVALPLVDGGVPVSRLRATSVALGDIDLDGYLDILMGVDGAHSKIFFNDGEGNFTEDNVVDLPEIHSTYGVALGDMDDNGTIDVVLANINEPGTIYYHDGLRGFDQLPSKAYGDAKDVDSMSVSVADFNSDGFLDIIRSGPGGNNEIFYYESSPVDGSVSYSPQILAGSSQYTYASAVGDFDNDGALDVLFGNNNNSQSVIFYNTSVGGFNRFQPAMIGEAWDVMGTALGDLNGDTYRDIVLVGEGDSLYLLNDGSGSFRYAEPHSIGPAGLTTASTAIGDLDGDHDLDIVLAAANGQSQVLKGSVSGGIPTYVSQPLDSAHNASGVALGDLDLDQDLDIVEVMQSGGPARIYFNNGSGEFTQSADLGTTQDSRAVVVRDIDGDGDLDIIQGNYQQKSLLYLNQGNGTFAPAIAFGGANKTKSIALADLDGDGDQDIIQGNEDQPSYIYEYQGNGVFEEHLLGISGKTTSLAVADLNGDEWPDIVQGNYGEDSWLHFNEGGFEFSSVAIASSLKLINGLGLGDMDGDGDQDLVTAMDWNDLDPDISSSGVYLNHFIRTGATQTDPPGVKIGRPGGVPDAGDNSTSDILSGVIEIPYNLMDQEEDQADIFAYYSPDGGGTWAEAVSSVGDVADSVAKNTRPTLNIAGEFNANVVPGSSDAFDLVLEGFGPGEKISKLDVWVSVTGDTDSLSINLAAPDGRVVNLFSEVAFPGFVHVLFDEAADMEIQEAVPQADSLTGRFIPMSETITLSSLIGMPIGGQWTLNVTNDVTGADVTVDAWGMVVQGKAVRDASYPSTVAGYDHIFHWDPNASGFFGSSDNVIFRIYSVQSQGSYYSGISMYQRLYRAADSAPFRVRGNQVQVKDAAGQPVSGAIVLKQTPGQAAAQVMADRNQQPFLTDTNGYLQGNGEIKPPVEASDTEEGYEGDLLYALKPVEVTSNYTRYDTSAPVTLSGTQGMRVNALGVQSLTVSAANPLYLFNLDISLEWDARQDPNFIEDLQTALEKASTVLYDVSNGQAALGKVRVTQNRENWLASDVVVYAQNGVRPRATMGGVVDEPVDDVGVLPTGGTQVIENAYNPGQIRMGPIWDPFGQSLAELNQDWQRALAHELSHYLLFLPDNYVGVENNRPIQTDCRGSFMTSTYDDAYSEFLIRDQWTGDCLKTMAQYTTARTDWETLTKFYPAMHEPQPSALNAGPGTLPLKLLDVTVVNPSGSEEILPGLIFDIRDAQGALKAIPRAQVYLFKTANTRTLDDDRVILLGSTIGGGDRIKVRGAAAGDRLCVLGPYNEFTQSAWQGCRIIRDSVDRSITVSEMEGWKPDVVVKSTSAKEFTVTVTLWQVIGSLPSFPGTLPGTLPLGNLNVEFFPFYGQPDSSAAPKTVSKAMTTTNNLVYTADLTLESDAYEGVVRVWTADGREAMTNVYLSPPWGPNQSGLLSGGNRRAWGANSRLLGAPVASGDGQVTIFNLNDIFADTGTVSLQAISSLPSLPPWLTPVGQGYRFTPNQQFERVIAFDYLQRDVPAGYEHTLRIYYSPDSGTTWQRLDTDIDIDDNRATAVMPGNDLKGEGIYAVMATVELPALSAGWNLVGYPLPGSRAVRQALASISGAYRSMQWFDGSAWRIYDPAVAQDHAIFDGLVNTLTELQFGQVYWLYANQDIVFFIGVPQAGEITPASALTQPPATIYGPVLASGAEVEAWAGQALCATAAIVPLNAGSAYKIQVPAGMSNGCGVEGQSLALKIAGKTVATAVWDNTQATYLPLEQGSAQSFIFLPLLVNP